MANAGNVLGSGSVLHGQHSLVNELAGTRSDNMGSQDLIGGLVGQNLDETVGVVVGLGTRVGQEGELAHLVGNTLLLQLLLALANPRDLGMRVDYTGHAVVVDVHVAAVDALNGDEALIFSLVRQHGSVDAVADGVNIGHHSLESGVDGDPAAVILNNAHGLQTQTFGVGTTSNTDQQGVALDLLFLARLGVLHGHGDVVAAARGSRHLGAQLELKTLLGEHLLERL